MFHSNNAKKKCDFTNCKKKIFLNGYCHSHIELAREKKAKFFPKPIDLEYREFKINERRHINNIIEQKKEEIEQFKKSMDYYNSSKYEIQKFSLRRMCENLDSFIEMDKFNIDAEVEDLLNFYRNINRQKTYTKVHEDDDLRDGMKKSEKAERKAERKKERDERKHEEREERKERKEEKQNNQYEYRGYNELDKYFEELGISFTTDVSIIKRAFRDKAKLVHPDRNINLDNGIDYNLLFQNLGTAYETIMNNLNK